MKELKKIVFLSRKFNIGLKINLLFIKDKFSMILSFITLP